jgi:hypothetical protein
VFSDDLIVMPPKRAIEFKIELQPSIAHIANALYMMSPTELAELKIQLQDLNDNGFIRLSSSPWGCLALFISMKDKDLRLCVNYRSLNAITIKNKYSFPCIDILFDQLMGAQVFSKVDLHSGYHQIKIYAEDIPKMAFSKRYGLYEYLVMSFGLTNFLAHFMYLMNSVFMPELNKFVVVLLMTYLYIQRVWKNMKFSKCEFWINKVSFLGHVISQEGIALEPGMGRGVLDWKLPKSVHQVRSFLGLACYY